MARESNKEKKKKKQKSILEAEMMAFIDRVIYQVGQQAINRLIDDFEKGIR